VYLTVLYACVILTLRPEPSHGRPPKPPMRPRHTFQELNVEGLRDTCDGGFDERRLATSPTYVDPQELNTKLPGGENVE